MAIPYFSKKTRVIVPPGSQAGDLFMNPFYFRIRQGLFKSEKYPADFGTLVVLENRAKPGSRLIALPVLRIHAVDPHPLEPIFHLEGGPGSSNIEFVPPAWMLEKHDFVLVGYRGADGSSILQGPLMAKAARGIGDDLLSEESRALLFEATRQEVRRFEESGVDLAGYVMTEVIDDIEAVRKGLGYERINLLSESYGTRLAQIYAYMYPDSIFRSAMMGVNPPGRFVFEPDTTDSLLANYADLWAKDPYSTSRSPDLLSTLRNVNRNMPKRWLFIHIDRSKTRISAFSLFFHTRTSPYVFDAYVAAEHGDPSGLALMSAVYNLFIPRMMIWGDLFAKGHCADYDPNRKYAETLETPNSVMGSPQALLMWNAAQAWPATMLPEALRRVQQCAVQTLLISGNLDFSTPAKYATNELLPYLSNGRQVILKEFGHCDDIWRWQPAATKRLLTRFFESGVADDSMFHYQPVNFRVRFGFPFLAKLLMGVLFAIPLAILAIILVILF